MSGGKRGPCAVDMVFKDCLGRGRVGEYTLVKGNNEMCSCHWLRESSECMAKVGFSNALELI